MSIKLPEVSFDFRDHANPNDELKRLWDSWTPYYTTKAAIAAWLQPTKILEIGVRYGYSAKAFLAGAPAAHYTGIDLDVKTNGGVADDFTWARSILPQETTLIKADTQKMEFLPGGIYDLIHVDGQQTGASTYHDLELASAQGRWILCDGYFWTTENFNAANDFIRNHREIIETVIILPGYAGEMLININDSYINLHSELVEGRLNADEIKLFYKKNPQILNSVTHDSSSLNSNHSRETKEINHIEELANPTGSSRLLDIGCGKGEITIQALLAGASVTAVESSLKALELAQENVAKLKILTNKIEWQNNSASTMKLEGKYDIATCREVLELMTPQEIEFMYKSVADHLASKGQFIVHTSPNRWFYDYDYPQRQRKAAELGAHLPFQPRSRFERLVHINEQRPQTMRRQLKKHFQHVLFWFASPENPLGSLNQKMNRRELAAARDLYAIASHHPINKENVIQRLSPTPPLKLKQASSVKINAFKVPQSINAGEITSLEVEIKNLSDIKIGERMPNPVRASYHWKDATTGKVTIFDGERTTFGSIHSGQSVHIPMKVTAPLKQGRYMLQIRLVQEMIRWHEGDGFDTNTQDHPIQVV
jgi:2-polyprenyl-3-methyl-5-hydroxy-6-metoxy-1,4-benzoquinol methylase